MQHSTEDKGDELSFEFTKFPPNHELFVQMSIEKHMNRFIPLSVELFISGGVPPFFIEASVVKFCNFSKNICDVFKGNIKHHDDKNGPREHFSQQKFPKTYLIPHFHIWNNILSVDYV